MADPSTAPPLIPSSIAEAHTKIKQYIHMTPLITSKSMNAIASHEDPSSFLSSNPPQTTTSTTTSTSTHPPPKFKLYFKCENTQKIGAFKARGAHHALIRLISEQGLSHVQSRGVITHSSGNHAQALAQAASNFDVPAYIVMPTIATPSKIAGTQMYTDKVVFSGPTAAEREAKVAELVERTGAILIPPYDHPDIILGQGTAAFEMERQFQDIKAGEISNGITTDESPLDKSYRFDAVLTPLGGGGLLSGTATWFSHTYTPIPTVTATATSLSTGTQTATAAAAAARKQTLIFGSEPSFNGANDGQIGLSQTPPTRIPHVSSLTIADGLRTPVGLLPWTVISDTTKVAGVYSATEQEIKDALRLMMERAKVFVEPSAVVPVAVVLFCREFRDRVAGLQRLEGTGRSWDVGVVLSGGNTTVAALSGLFAGAGTERQMGSVGINGERVAEDVAG